MEHMFESTWWLRLVAVWELVVYNPVVDLGTWWFPLLVLGGVIVAAARSWSFRRHELQLKRLHGTPRATTERDLNV
jgi:hypothetical protein